MVKAGQIYKGRVFGCYYKIREIVNGSVFYYLKSVLEQEWGKYVYSTDLKEFENKNSYELIEDIEEKFFISTSRLSKIE